MSSNWMWLVVLAAAAGHALRWVPPDASARQVKIPVTFALLYVLYAIALAARGLGGILAAFVAVEVALQIVRRRRPAPPARRGGGGVQRLRR